MVVIDDAHGQSHWQQTGFASRELHTNFSGIAEIVSKAHGKAVSGGGESLAPLAIGTTLLVVPPPAGNYDSRAARWQRDPHSLFHPSEIFTLLGFLSSGGRLLAFGYRFGDSFTETNLKDIFSPLGCHLNDDAVIDLDQLQHQHPLKSQFQTSRDLICLPWARANVRTVFWRTMATFTILPGATAEPLVLSPGGRCVAFNRTTRELSFESAPIAVVGNYGKGRFVLFGGPHAFETGPLGLLPEADNAHFAANVLSWLFHGARSEPVQLAPTGAVSLGTPCVFSAPGRWPELSRIQGRGKGEKTIAFVERTLRRKGIFRALGRARWAP